MSWRTHLVAAASGLIVGLAPTVGTAQEASSKIRFREVAAEWGVDFRHHHGGSGKRYMVESMVGGVVIFDFDRDGDEDLMFIDGGVLPGYEGEKPRSRLYRNEGGRFIDYTDRSGIDFGGYGCGAVSGDYDGDGDLDLYVTAFGANALFENRGDGTFTDRTAETGVGETLWSAGASFVDVDRDSDLDLYVVNYVDFALDNHKFCGDERSGLQGYCNPDSYNGEKDVFFRNLGGGVFEEQTAAAGFEGPIGAGLGIVAGDLDNDGWVDLYVANDSDPNLLFLNKGDGTFDDLSLMSGTAYGNVGMPEAGMGVDLGDVDVDGLLDVVVTNFELETNALYKNLGGGLFTDARFSNNVAEASLLQLTFGVDLADFDNDGDLDLMLANGHILDNAAEFNKRSRYAQENQVLENLGDGRFQLVEEPGFEEVLVSRGLATGDLDGDGDLDAAIINTGAEAVVYENLLPAGSDWLRLDFAGGGENSHGIGTRAVVGGRGGGQLDEVRTSSSYLSQNALTLHFGLRAAPADARTVPVDVLWASGRRQRLELPINRRIRLVEPAGSAGAAGGGLEPADGSVD